MWLRTFNIYEYQSSGRILTPAIYFYQIWFKSLKIDRFIEQINDFIKALSFIIGITSFAAFNIATQMNGQTTGVEILLMFKK